MVRSTGYVLAKPVDGPAVAGLTPHTVGELKSFRATLHRHVISMAVQAHVRFLRPAKAKIAGNALGLCGQQCPVGARMGIVLFPHNIFVLHHRGTRPRLQRTVTARARTGGNSKMRARRHGRQNVRALRVCRSANHDP